MTAQQLNRKVFETEFAGRLFKLEFSRIGNQANSAVIGKYGETIVLVTTVMAKEDKGVDYLPLLVDYEERFYAAGKIIGSRFVRREGRASEEAVLSGRLIDRTIRPLFDQRIRRNIQVVVTVLSIDEENDPDFVALATASAALAASDIPWNGPVAGAKLAVIGGEVVVNPTASQLKGEGVAFDAFISGNGAGVNMIELSGSEADEDLVADAFEKANREIGKLIAWQKEIAVEIGKPKAEVELSVPDEEFRKKVDAFIDGKLEAAIYVGDKVEYRNKISEVKRALIEHLETEGLKDKIGQADLLFEEAIDRIVSENILKKEKRPDGRRLDEVRPLYAEARLFERPHGSALFIRGNTQVLAVTTLAAPGAEQLVETMETTGKKRFMLHYNFPSFCTGEIGSSRGPGRREIGHGALAFKAVAGLIPPAEEFPYTIRVVAETLSSNGSSSMATVCASSLSLMDAGVPIKRPAAGIAMGLILGDGGEYKILTDIQGPEDHHGDMDLKIAGTEKGVTAIQMDVKVDAVGVKILRETFKQAKKARLEILETMASALAKPRENISAYAPVVLTMKIDPAKIGEVIGAGGKVINSIVKMTGGDTIIDIEQDGSVFIAAPKRENAQAAYDHVAAIVREFQVGEIVEGTVSKIMDFGAIVDIAPGRDGMIHVSELKDGFVKKVEDVVKIGDYVRAKVIRVEDGRIGLSLRGVK